ncbi:MAG: hypothetical protein HY721_03030 [Planctomycetes bacterium]|nr:hypothetical protein [Planctomycetota bacterium]
MLREKVELLRRKFTTGLSSRDERRLEYLVWLIDQIEDPALAESLERLEQLAAEYAEVAARVNDAAEKVTAACASGSRKGKPRGR